MLSRGREHLKDHRPREVSQAVSVLGDQGVEHGWGALSRLMEVGRSVGKEDPSRSNTPVKAVG